MGLNIRTISGVVATLGLVWLAGCKPDYPLCGANDDCQVAEHLGDVCVNGTCQECLEDNQCVERKGENFFCNSGRCEARPEPEPQCAVNEDCQSNQKCEAQQCVAAPESTQLKAIGEACNESTECGTDNSCLNGLCVTAEIAALIQKCQSYTTDTAPQRADHSILFEFNDHQLTEPSRSELQMAAECLKLSPNSQIVLEGHCDDRGTQEYNLALGEKRANSVKKYLAALGVDLKQLITRSKGENEPICRDPSENCWAQNRRVLFITAAER